MANRSEAWYAALGTLAPTIVENKNDDIRLTFAFLCFYMGKYSLSRKMSESHLVEKNLQQFTSVIKVFWWYKNLDPKGLYVLVRMLFTCIHKKY